MASTSVSLGGCSTDWPRTNDGNSSSVDVLRFALDIPSPSERPKLVCRGETSGGNSFSKKMDELRKCGWYWGPITWQEAEELLCDQSDGAFLVRDSTNDRHIFSLSFKTANGVQHARINQNGQEFFFGSPNCLLSSRTIVGLIESAVRCSVNGTLRFLVHPSAGAFPVDTISLLHPFSRFTVVPSLKHMVRFEILKHLPTRDKIDQLPLPWSMKMYLKDPKYVAEL